MFCFLVFLLFVWITSFLQFDLLSYCEYLFTVVLLLRLSPLCPWFLALLSQSLRNHVLAILLCCTFRMRSLPLYPWQPVWLASRVCIPLCSLWSHWVVWSHVLWWFRGYVQSVCWESLVVIPDICSFSGWFSASCWFVLGSLRVCRYSGFGSGVSLVYLWYFFA